MRRWIVPCLGLAALAACQSAETDERAAETASAVDSWIGASEEEVLAAWGAPTSADPLADGSKILQYVQTRQQAAPGSARIFPPQTTFERGLYDRFRPRDGLVMDNEYDSTISGLRPAGRLVEVCRTRFTVSPEGAVRAVQTEGSGCGATAIPRSTG